MNDPKFDVAISFLHQDEPLASDLESRLSPSMSVFVYSKKQEEVAGTDGLETFRDVFLNQSRLVVVLFRNGWGQSPWTRVEQAAITDRFLHAGWDWLLFVMLDPKSIAPAWLPQSKIRLDLQEYGIEQCVGAIKTRAQELGATVRKETIQELFERLKKDKLFQEHRGAYLGSQQAAVAAKKEASELFNAVETLVAGLSDPQAKLVFRTKQEYDSLAVRSSGFTLYISWHNEASNMLYNSALLIRLCEVDRNDHFNSWRNEKTRLEKQYAFDINPSEQSGWREEFGDKRFLDASAVAEEWVKRLLEHIHKHLIQSKR